METFIMFYFITICISGAITLTKLFIGDYPHAKQITKGYDIFSFFVIIALAIWSGVLLFGVA